MQLLVKKSTNQLYRDVQAGLHLFLHLKYLSSITGPNYSDRRNVFLAHWIRTSEILPWDRNSDLTHTILPRLSHEGYIHWLYWNSRTNGSQMTSLLIVKVTSSSEIASKRIQGLLEAYSKIKKQWWARKRIHYSHECRIEKSVPCDHSLSSLCKPCNAKRWSSG